MQPAAEQLAERLKNVSIGAPLTTIYSVADVRAHTSADGIRQALVEQLTKPVRWSATVKAILETGVSAIVECGPGKILSGLNRRIERNKDIAMVAIEDSSSLKEA